MTEPNERKLRTDAIEPALRADTKLKNEPYERGARTEVALGWWRAMVFMRVFLSE
jgi:hypothetical protein